MTILVSGSSGLIGSDLIPLLEKNGHRVIRLVRKKNSGIFWNPDEGTLDTNSLEGIDIIIHLAGESIASGRWTPEKKSRIRDSRVKGTSLLAQAVSQLKKPPQIFISASAIGFYGNRGPEVLTEESGPGQGFLTQVCQEWEKASLPVQEKGVRLVYLRTGIVVSPKGGALKKMLPPFQLGLGGMIGNGQQFMSWISLPDVVGAIQHILAKPTLKGPVNLVSPQPVTNREWTKTLGRVLKRPTLFPMPAFAARLVFGEMADEMLLASTRVQPSKLIASGYRFQHSDLEKTLTELIHE